jgi:hypothetical protein
MLLRRFYKVLQGSTRFYWVRFYWVRFYWVQFYWVQFYWVQFYPVLRVPFYGVLQFYGSESRPTLMLPVDQESTWIRSPASAISQ